MSKPYYEYLHNARKVALGFEEREDFLPIIYECEPELGDDWTDINCYIKSNPAMGLSTSKEYIQAQINKCKTEPLHKREVQQKLFNVYVSDSSNYISVDDWDRCKSDFSPKALEGMPLYLGLDLSLTNDLSSLYCYHKDGEGESFAWGYNFCPSADIDANQVRYRKWEKDGHLIRTHGLNGKTTDHNVIAEVIVKLFEKYDVKMLSYDAYASHSIMQKLVTDYGIRPDKLVAMRQSTLEFGEPMKTLHSEVLNEELRHLNEAPLRFAIANAVAVYDGNNNSKLMKNKSLEKIDPIVSLLMAKRSYLKYHSEFKSSAFNREDVAEAIKHLWD